MSIRNNPAQPDSILGRLPSEIERGRYENLLRNLALWTHLFRGHLVLDFGASWGTSMVALARLGAGEVVGVEPSMARIRDGQALIRNVVSNTRISYIQTSYGAGLPFVNDAFHFVLANGVLEHIPQPRDRYVRELWRVLAPAGCLMINETPNKYFPKEVHTTSLLFNHWLPSKWAHRRAIRHHRFEPHRTDWDSSGWRGLGYLELTGSLGAYRLIHERTKLRHRLFKALGLPASILDPYPTWVFQKIG